MNINEFSTELGQLISGLEDSVFQLKTDRRTATAFVVEKGFLVTAAHALRKGGDIRIVSASGDESPVRVVGRDHRFNLALLESEGAGTPGETDDGEELMVGHLVFPIGRPNRTLQAAFGMVSALERSRRLHGGGELSRYIETDGSLPGGFSGGPLMNSSGKILGMNSSVPRGAGMTVPMADIKSAISRIREIGDVKRGYLGINTYPVPLTKTAAGGQMSGLMITEVETGSPAEKADLRQGDILCALADSPVEDVMALVSVLGSGIGGREVTARLLRSGEKVHVSVTPV